MDRKKTNYWFAIYGIGGIAIGISSHLEWTRPDIQSPIGTGLGKVYVNGVLGIEIIYPTLEIGEYVDQPQLYRVVTSMASAARPFLDAALRQEVSVRGWEPGRGFPLLSRSVSARLDIVSRDPVSEKLVRQEILYCDEYGRSPIRVFSLLVNSVFWGVFLFVLVIFFRLCRTWYWHKRNRGRRGFPIFTNENSE